MPRIAVTDPLQIIATGLTTIDSQKLLVFLKEYFSRENVERILIGMPRNLDDRETDASAHVLRVIVQLKKEFPAIPVISLDERFTSKMASRAMVEMGMKKKQRRNKAMVDEIAATILLQGYLEGNPRT
jgi:putative holliday junction resolvase